MRSLAKKAFLVLAVGAVLPLIVLALALDAKPLLRRPAAAQETHGQQSLQADLQGAEQGRAARTVRLTANDIETAANDLITRKGFDGVLRAEIEVSQLMVVATIRLPGRSDLFLNIRLTAEDGDTLPAVTGLQVGTLPLPAFAVNALLTWQLGRRGLLRDEAGGHGPVLSARIQEGRLNLTFAGESETAGRLRELVTEEVGTERVLVYHNRLAMTVKESNTRQFVRVGQLMRSLFALADERSRTGDPAEENRAVILLLAAYVNGYDLMSASGSDAMPLPERAVLLQGRQDLGRHFMISAALALAGQRALADTIGLTKELNDTHSGSGFSFTDLAADRAGTLFGKRAVRPQYARRIQDMLSGNSDESVFMPQVGDLPERLQGPEFFRRFHYVTSPEFHRLNQVIDERLNNLPLYAEH